VKLFHGLSHAIVDKIIEAGFDEVRRPLRSKDFDRDSHKCCVCCCAVLPLSQRVSNLAGMFGCNASPSLVVRTS
jgi:hypothetical protein